MNPQEPQVPPKLMLLAVMVAVKFMLFVIFARTESIHFVYAGF